MAASCKTSLHSSVAAADATLVPQYTPGLKLTGCLGITVVAQEAIHGYHFLRQKRNLFKLFFGDFLPGHAAGRRDLERA